MGVLYEAHLCLLVFRVRFLPLSIGPRSLLKQNAHGEARFWGGKESEKFRFDVFFPSRFYLALRTFESNFRRGGPRGDTYDLREYKPDHDESAGALT